MAIRIPLRVQVDVATLQRLRTVVDAIMIGVVERSTGVTHLYEAAPITNVPLERFAGHSELVRHGVVSAAESLGFSIHVSGGKVRAFYRTSILNRDLEDFSVPYAMMLKVLDEVGLPRSSDFRSYPKETTT